MNKKLLSTAVAAALFLSTAGTMGTTYAADTGKGTFSDISGSYAEDAIRQLAEAGILNGIDGTHFDPKGELTRAQFITLMVKAMGLPVDTTKTVSSTFKDVTGWAAPYIDAAFAAGIVHGTSATTFSPNASVTREQTAVIMVLALQSVGEIPKTATAPLNFKDADNISSWAKDYVALALQYGLMKGNADGTFNPKGNATREQAAVMGSNFLTSSEEVKKNTKPEDTDKPTETTEPTKPTVTPPSGGGTYVPPVVIAPKISSDASLKVLDGGGLQLDFSIDKAIDLSDPDAQVKIEYFTQEGSTLVPIKNSLASDAPLVKDKTWDGYLYDMDNGASYSKGTANVASNIDLIPANAHLATIVRNGFHAPATDMDYTNINWSLGATYVAKITVTDANGTISAVKTVMTTVTAPTVTNASLKVLDGGGLQLDFSIDKAIDLSDPDAQVKIEYFTQEGSTLVPIKNSLASDAPLVKDKTWDGYLYDMNNGASYSKGTANVASNIDLIPANAHLATIVRNGFHAPATDMDYTNINWSLGATYVAKITVTDANGTISAVKTVMTTVTAPTVTNASLKVLDGGGLQLDFSIDKAIDLSDPDAQVKIEYFTQEGSTLVPIKNSLASDAPLVKDKTWDGYLYDMDNGASYSKGTANVASNIDLIPANAHLATIVRNGFHAPATDMDYVDIDWKRGATYVAKITVTDASGKVSEVKSVFATVDAPAVSDASLSLIDEGGLLINFTVGEKIDLADESSNVEISYFTKDEDGHLLPLQNTKTSNALVKDKTWDGYLWTPEQNYSTGGDPDSDYLDAIPANTPLASIVSKGFHAPATDMDYETIDWTEAATYVAQIKVTNSFGHYSVQEVTVTAPDRKAPAVTGATLSLIDGGGLLVNFTVGEAINLANGQSNIEISYFTENENGSFAPIQNTKTSGALVKNKAWDGYLWTPEHNYSSGNGSNGAYSDVVPADTQLASIVSRGFHAPDTDMDYVEINWDQPATYVAKIKVTDAAGNSTTKEARITVNGQG